jgi:hypothetical protein
MSRRSVSIKTIGCRSPATDINRSVEIGEAQAAGPRLGRWRESSVIFVLIGS